MTRTGLSDDYVYCTSEGEEVGTPEEEDDDDDDDDERSVLTENNEEEDDAEAEEEGEEDVWKADDDLSLSNESDSLDGDESSEADSPATAEVAALRWQVRVLKQTLAAQRLANDLLRRRATSVTYDCHQQDEEHRGRRANAEESWKPPLSSPGESHRRDHNTSALNDKEENGPIHHLLSRSWFDHPEATRKVLQVRAHLVFACLAFLVYTVLNGGGANVVSSLPFLKLFLCSRKLLSIAIGRGGGHALGEGMFMRTKQVSMEDARLLLWVVLCVVQPHSNSSTTLVAALVASLAVDCASDIVKQQQHSSSRANSIGKEDESLAASIVGFVGPFFAWETYTGLPLLVLIFLEEESTLTPQSCAVLALQTLVHMALSRRRQDHLRQQHVPNDPSVLLVLHASAWGLYRWCGFGLYFVVVAGGLVVHAVQGGDNGGNARRQAVVTEAKKRD